MASGASGPSVELGVLGPLQLVVDGQEVAVRGPKRRAVLALLALAEGRLVTADDLVEALWAEEPPESGRAALHSHVSRLRGHLGPAAGRLQTRESGYRLALLDDALDATRARRLLARARVVGRQDPATAMSLLGEARRLWRGPVLADLAEVGPIASSTVALATLYRDLTALQAAFAVEAGVSEGTVDLAGEAVAADPMAEQPLLLLVRALAADGRTVDALQVAREYRRRLTDETGLDPSPALGELEQRVASGERDDLPAPATPAPLVPGALMRPATPLVGRDAQIAALQRLLVTERLVSVVGPGGVGKTRLALEVARRTTERTVLLLAPVSDRADVPSALATALGVRVLDGDPLDACVAVLRPGRRLLVIDNCEHVLAAVRVMVGALLEDCPGLTVLTTSREVLGLPVECPSRLAPLALPDPRGDAPESAPAVAVFLERARRVRPGFAPDDRGLATVFELVRRLDGIPLAIEMAAGRLSTLSLTDLAQRLDRSLDLLGGPPAADVRHRTLRATVAWSYDLLPEDERRLFRHLCVFVDGVDLTTAEQVAEALSLSVDPGSALAHLVDASMIDASFPGGTRFGMLETIRAFGLDRLAAAGETGAAEAELLRWAVQVTGWIDSVVTTAREPEADAVLRRELRNLVAAWRLARRRGAVDEAVGIVVALHEISGWRDQTETWGWSEELAADSVLAGHPRAGEVIGAAAYTAYLRGDYPRAERQALEGLAVASTSSGSCLCLSALAVAALSRGAFVEAVGHAESAALLSRRPSENLGVAALAATYAGDLDRARGLLASLAAVADSPTLLGFAAYVRGETENLARRWDRAEHCYRDAVGLARESGATFLAGISSVGLLSALVAAERFQDALRGYSDVIDYWSEAGNWTQLWVTLRNLAQLLRLLGDPEPAALIDAAADEAPDAPTAPGPHGHSRAEPIGRSAALDAARRSIAHHLRPVARAAPL